jgi:hypothetical protein
MPFKLEKVSDDGRWIQVFPDSDPEVKVKVKPISESATNRLYDRHKILEGKRTAAKLAAFAKDSVNAAVIEWEGFVDGSGEPVPCDSEHKQLLLESRFVDDDGEVKTIWQRINEVMVRQLEDDRKNF